MNIESLLDGSIKQATKIGEEAKHQAEDKLLKPGKKALKQAEKEGKKAKKKGKKAKKKAEKRSQKRSQKSQKKTAKNSQAVNAELDEAGTDLKNIGSKPVQLVASVLTSAIKDVKKGKVPKGIDFDDLLSNLKSLVGNLPFSKDAIAMYHCMKDSETPTYVKGIIAAALTYLFLPEDVIPEWVVGLGFTDDVIVMSTVLSAVSSSITEEHWQKAEEFFEA
jgi:uncharacterized membrane protein YkvA (DUF1232 family)